MKKVVLKQSNENIALVVGTDSTSAQIHTIKIVNSAYQDICELTFNNDGSIVELKKNGETKYTTLEECPSEHLLDYETLKKYDFEWAGRNTEWKTKDTPDKKDYVFMYVRKFTKKIHLALSLVQFSEKNNKHHIWALYVSGSASNVFLGTIPDKKSLIALLEETCNTDNT